MRTLRAVAAALALAGCAGPTVQRPAHGSYDAAFRLEVWQRAVMTLGAHGYELSFEDPALGVLVTRERESQAPCGETTCLSRETVYVRLDGGHLFVNVARMELCCFAAVVLLIQQLPAAVPVPIVNPPQPLVASQRFAH